MTIRFARMRHSFADFSIRYPGRKYRHDKPDMKVLLEKKDESYVDVAEATSQQSVSSIATSH